MSLNIFILIATVIVSFMAFNNVELFNKLRFNAWLIKHKKQSYRFLSYGLVHAGWMHLIINMWVLYSFGGIVEEWYKFHYGAKGILFYGLLYIGGLLFATLFDFMKNKDNVNFNAVGASGAVSAVIFASILFEPTGGIFIFPIPFAIPSWTFGIIYLIYSAYMGKKAQDNIGHNAHFWGAVFGLVFTIILVPSVVSSFFNQLF